MGKTKYTLLSALPTKNLGDLPIGYLDQLKEYMKYTSGIFKKDDPAAKQIQITGLNDHSVIGQIIYLANNLGISGYMSIYENFSIVEKYLLDTDYVIIVTSDWDDMWARYKLKSIWRSAALYINAEKIIIWQIKNEKPSAGSAMVM